MRSYGRAGWIAVLVMVCVSALIIGRNTQLQAQGTKKTYATVAEVTNSFMRVITGEQMAQSVVGDATEEEAYGDYGATVKDFDWRSAGVFSARDQDEFSSGEIQTMVERMKGAWRNGELNSKSWEVEEEVIAESGTKTVRLKQTIPVTPEIVASREGDSWRVNLRETYVKWFNLKSETEFSTHLHQLKLQSCQSNLRQVSLATFQYVMDYDEKFPLAKDWQGDLDPYLKNRLAFHCPILPDKPSGVGYAYNWKLNDKSMRVIDYPATMIAYYETSVREPSHSGEGADTEYRHDQGINLAFADGHVKWYSKQEWPKPDWGAHFTFKQP